jgi:hypothetical protein
VTDRVPFHIGPLPSSVALAWIDNSRRLLLGVRDARVPLDIEVHEDLVDLCDSLLSVWEAHARRDATFDVTLDVDVAQLTGVARQWLEIGRLTDDELDAIGCTWAPPDAQPFSIALETGVIHALAAAGEAGEPLLRRLGPTTEP